MDRFGQDMYRYTARLWRVVITMKYQYIPYIWPLLLSGVITASLGIYTFLKRRKAKGAYFFTLCMLELTVWSLSNVLEMSAVDLQTKLIWANVQYFAYCYSPVTLVILCMQFTGYDRMVKDKRIIWFFALPTIIAALVWTDVWFGLIRYDFQLSYEGTFPVITKKYGLGFYIHALYSHIMNLFSAFLLIRAVFFKITVYRNQARALLVGISLIIIPNLSYILDFSPLDFDITPLFFGPAGVIMLWGLFHYRIFDLVPMARETVVESMRAGIMVFDIQDRVIDVNPAFVKIFKDVPTCLSIPEFNAAYKDRNRTNIEFSFSSGEEERIYEAHFSLLLDKKDNYLGRLATLQDITNKRLLQQERLDQQWKLAVIDERERLARDLHDNIGQILGFINFQAQAIKQNLQKEDIEIIASKLEQLVEVTQTAQSDIRDYIHNVRNSNNLEKNFLVSLKNMIQRFEEQYGLTIILKLTEQLTGEELSPIKYVNILNIIKEALNNVTKHAQANRAVVSLALDKDVLYVTVEDDGKGFDIVYNNSKTKSKFGLDIMRERAAIIGATIKIASIVDRGSCVFLSIPVENK